MQRVLMKTANPSRVGVKTKSVAARVATVIIVLSVVVLPGIVNHAQQLDVSQQALLYAAQINNLPLDRLAIANTAWLANEIFRAKVLDKVTGEIDVVSVHSSGTPATDEEVAELVRADLMKGFVGKVQASLKSRADAAPSGTSSVNIWVNTPQIPRAAWHFALEQGRREQVFNESAAFHLNAETPVLQFLHNLGLQEKYASRYAPVITCQVPNGVLAQLETLPEVLRIYGDERAVPALNTSIPTIKAQKVWNQGVTGSGVKVAIIEAQLPDGTNAIANANPFAGPVTYYDLMHTQSGRHATEVAGVVASTDVTYQGVSYGVPRPSDLLNGNPSGTQSSDLNAATGWAASQNASVINQSYGLDPPPAT